MDIDDLVVLATEQARVSGFTKPGVGRAVSEHAALLHSEVSEMFEAHRDGLAPADFWYEHRGHELSQHPENEERELGKPVGIPSELADLVIRVCNMAGEYHIDLGRAVEEKMAYNVTRPKYHGRRGDAAAG
jgi:NTP pyrophosphatase (non-canonical NTP hydrolase)